ncbi:hypothetical protein NDI76_00310 [Halogeometricum sp. S1BR25-6]|uniref:Uncharacterized protein n=1 Tax=Halogeometricum salsisoli TaxID=2950536 RepID=A0ABU2G8N3_9EURY|nr:hypothetical protein [Halogeometricum sp. S1BR25-6]MDS0297182.1 hypothetical protein [Halogeometricum sp. S1BR25-6]
MSMRQLRSCDFCGEDASGIYEVLPAELSPTEDEQRRVVLCDDCLQTLETVVDPLLARLGFDAAASRDTAVEERERGESPEPVSASGVSNREGDITERPVATSTANTVDAPDAPDAPDATDATPMTTEAEDAVRSADGGIDGDDEDESAHGETADVDDDGSRATSSEETSDEETFGDRPAEDYEVDEETVAEETEAATDAETPAATEDGAPTADEERRDETSDEETFGDRPAEDYEVDDADRRQSADGDPAEDYEVEDDVREEVAAASEELDDAEAIEAEPEKFRRVMRLLNNRDLPVDRDEFADVAAGAYELDRSEVDAIIDYAVRRDVLEEEDGRLQKA